MGMDYKEALQTLRDFLSRGSKLEKEIVELRRAGERFLAYSNMLPHTEPRSVKGTPRVEFTELNGGWGCFLHLTNYGSVTEDEDGEHVTMVSYTLTPTKDPHLVHRLWFEAYFLAYHLRCPLWLGNEMVNKVPVPGKFPNGKPCEVISDPDEEGWAWCISEGRSVGKVKV